MVTIKSPDTPSIENAPVQSVKIEESNRHNLLRVTDTFSKEATVEMVLLPS